MSTYYVSDTVSDDRNTAKNNKQNLGPQGAYFLVEGNKYKQHEKRNKKIIDTTMIIDIG